MHATAPSECANVAVQRPMKVENSSDDVPPRTSCARMPIVRACDAVSGALHGLLCMCVCDVVWLC